MAEGELAGTGAEGVTLTTVYIRSLRELVSTEVMSLGHESKVYLQTTRTKKT